MTEDSPDYFADTFYLRKEQRQDAILLWLLVCSFVTLLVQAFMLECVLPQRGE